MSLHSSAVAGGSALGARLSTGPAILQLSSVDGALLANGRPFRLKGVVWWGAESSRSVPGGLEKRSLDEVLGVLERYGFNAIKIPFLHQFVLFDEELPDTSFDHRLNPQLLDAATGQPIKYVAMLRAIARRAASRGMLVVLSAHSLEGLWYSRSIKEATVLDSWTSLARQLCSQWNVVGVDLKNRPWAASWGKGTPYDWDRAAARLGNHVNSECPRWLIGVEGVGETPGAAQDPEAEFAQMYPSFHQGENLVGARKAPVLLNDPSRLVYMPHSYGPGVRSLPYMEIEDFPENTEQVWDEHFLFLRKRAEARQPSALILNVGGPYEGSPRDRMWQDWALRAAAAHGLSLFYDGLNPKSGIGGESPYTNADGGGGMASGGGAAFGGPPINNTGGLFLPSWQAMHQGKLHLLAQLPATRVTSVLRAGSPPPPPPLDDDYGELSIDAPSPPRRAPPPEEESPFSPRAIALGVFVALMLLGQLGLLKGLAALRARLDPFLPCLAPLWSLLAVPSPDEATNTAGGAAGAPMPMPRAKLGGSTPEGKPSARAAGAKAAAADEDGEDEESTGLCSGTTPHSAVGKGAARRGGGGGKSSGCGSSKGGGSTKKSGSTTSGGGGGGKGSGTSKSSSRSRRARAQDEDEDEEASSGDEPERIVAPRGGSRGSSRSAASLSWED